MRYRQRQEEDPALRTRLKELALVRRRWGYLRLQAIRAILNGKKVKASTLAKIVIGLRQE